MGAQPALRQPGRQGRRVLERGPAQRIMADRDVVQGCRVAQPQAEGLAQRLLGGETLGEEGGGPGRGAVVDQLAVGQELFRRALPVARQQALHALDGDDIGADPGDQAWRPSRINRFMRRTASSQPRKRASATMAWPILSSAISRMAATGLTLP